MVWYNFLKSEGYFNPDDNPETIPVKGGYEVPRWEVLYYLEKLSLQIKEGKEVEFGKEIVDFIEAVSKKPKENYWTWYMFIKILINLPNDIIPAHLLSYIPVWLSAKMDTLVQSSEICERLLPKFLNDTPSMADIEKAEIILYHLFEIYKKERDENKVWKNETVNYYSRVYLHFLSTAFEDKELIAKVALHCSNDIILEIAKTIKKLLLNQPEGTGAFIVDGHKVYLIKIFVEDQNLEVVTTLKDSVVESKSTISKYEEFSEDELRTQLIELLKAQGINYVPIEKPDDIFERLKFTLSNDLFSMFGSTSIKKLGGKYYDSDEVFDVFAFILRRLLEEKVKLHPKGGSLILQMFFQDKGFRLPFFRRIALYVISTNWENTKEQFWQAIKNTDEQHFFSKVRYEDELYDLLKQNQNYFTSSEKDLLHEIIGVGPQEEINDENDGYLQDWQLKWYSALKDIPPFNDKYLELSQKLDKTDEDYEGNGDVVVKRGSVSPISIDDFLKKSNQAIADMLRTFMPKDRWDEPNISGLSDTLKSAVELDPEKFTNELHLFHGISYLHAYQLLYGLNEAWRNQKTFNWENVLRFCLEYIKDGEFYSGGFQIEHDGWGANFNWVVGAIGPLLTQGLQNDEKAFDLSLMPLAKEILLILCNNLEATNDFKDSNMDHLTYSLNSTGGKVLRAVLDYSLRNARCSPALEHIEDRWDPDLKKIFEEKTKGGVIDGYILEGAYFEQYHFLDKNWIIAQVKTNYDLSEKEWRAFMDGFAITSPPFNVEMYNLFYPHYVRAIETNFELKSRPNKGVILHLVAFYLWGYEDIKNEGLLSKFISHGSPGKIQDLIRIISQQREYVGSLNKLEKENFDKKILELWKFLMAKYDSDEMQNSEILANLSKFIVFISELNSDYTSLLLKSSIHVHRYYHVHSLLENLIRLKDKGNLADNAKFTGEILTSTDFKNYVHDNDENYIIELVSFLFKNGQKDVAAKFCNHMAVNNRIFLREVYTKNMN